VSVLTANPAPEFHVQCQTTTSDILSTLRLKQGETTTQDTAVLHAALLIIN